MGWKKKDTQFLIGLLITCFALLGFATYSRDMSGSFFQSLNDVSPRIIEASGGKDPQYAFDGKPETAWVSNSRQQQSSLSAVIDFSKPITIDTFTFLLETKGAYANYLIGLYGSLDNKDYMPISTNLATGYFTGEREFTFVVPPVKPRYVKVVFSVNGVIDEFKIKEIKISKG